MPLRFPWSSSRRRDSTPDRPPDEPDPAVRDAEAVLAYHQVTKHDLYAYARGPAGLDWESQPDPFRRYPGAELVPLLHPPAEGGPSWEDVLADERPPAAPVDLTSLSRLLRESLGLTAWKEAGEARWSLRANPSSGNLHPTEGYVVAGPVRGLCARPFVAHYAPREHALELRAELSDDAQGALAEILPAGGLLVGLTSIHWREAWKYGERAYRYCQHDVGHALAAVSIAAAGLGWAVRLLEGPSSEEVARVLGVGDGDLDEGPEPEEADLLLTIAPAGGPMPDMADGALARLAATTWHGAANTLSEGHEDWDIVERAAEAARRPRGAPLAPSWDSPIGPWARDGRASELWPLIRGRRSAVAMDHQSRMSFADFLRVMRSALPRASGAPLDALPWAPRVHLALFVHRVDDLEPGLYFLLRDPARERELRDLFREEFAWSRPEGTPDDLPLFRLHGADVRGLAARIACQQDIAGAGAFAAAMLAELEAPVAELGAWVYPRLYWECGAIGQVLYLEAEALGLSATGIGCYFDDPMHAVLGLRTRAWQSLYHFTIGGRVDDARITSLPAYPEG